MALVTVFETSAGSPYNVVTTGSEDTVNGDANGFFTQSDFFTTAFFTAGVIYELVIDWETTVKETSTNPDRTSQEQVKVGLDMSQNRYTPNELGLTEVSIFTAGNIIIETKAPHTFQVNVVIESDLTGTVRVRLEDYDFSNYPKDYFRKIKIQAQVYDPDTSLITKRRLPGDSFPWFLTHDAGAGDDSEYDEIDPSSTISIPTSAPGLDSTAFTLDLNYDISGLWLARKYIQNGPPYGGDDVFHLYFGFDINTLTKASSGSLVQDLIGIYATNDIGGIVQPAHDFVFIELATSAALDPYLEFAAAGGGAINGPAGSLATGCYHLIITRSSTFIAEDGTVEIIKDGVSLGTITGSDNFDHFSLINWLELRIAGTESVVAGTGLLDNIAFSPDPIPWYPVSGCYVVQSPVIINSSPPLTGTTGINYTYNITTSGGVAPIVITAPTKPAWLGIVDNLNGTATLSGIPPGASVDAVTVRADDSLGTFDEQSFSISVSQPITDEYAMYMYYPFLGGSYYYVSEWDGTDIIVKQHDRVTGREIARIPFAESVTFPEISDFTGGTAVIQQVNVLAINDNQIFVYGRMASSDPNVSGAVANVMVWETTTGFGGTWVLRQVAGAQEHVSNLLTNGAGMYWQTTNFTDISSKAFRGTDIEALDDLGVIPIGGWVQPGNMAVDAIGQIVAGRSQGGVGTIVYIFSGSSWTNITFNHPTASGTTRVITPA